MDELKKGYGGLIIVILLMTAVMFVLPFIPGVTAKGATILIMNDMTVSMAGLTYMIYKNQRVYWYTGIEYEEAVAAGEERRKKHAWTMFRRFGIFALVFLVYSVLSWGFDWSVAWDIVLCTFGMIGVAVSTMKVEL